jgi:dihydrofolate synthase/folylpolyglutamate synthase
MQDKDIAGVVARLGSRIDHWYLTDLPTARAATARQLEAALKEAGMTANVTTGTEPEQERSVKSFASPQDAFHAALNLAGEDDRIVVFGSFYTVAGVMQARNLAHH